jgi:hypothetical protein
MSVELINPNGIFEPDAYSQVAVGKGMPEFLIEVEAVAVVG